MLETGFPQWSSGKAFSAFHMLRMMVLGADTVNSARYKQLDVTDKGVRVANYHHSSMETLAELLSILGKDRLEELDAADINRRVNQGRIMNYAQLYPRIESRCLLHTDCAPDDWADDWRQATAYSWR